MSGFIWAAWGHFIEYSFPHARELAKDGGSYLWHFQRLIASQWPRG